MLVETNVDRGLDGGWRACELTLSDPRCWSDLGRVYAMLGDYSVALHYFVEAVRVEPRFADGWHHLGRACQELGRLQDALRAYRQALQLDDSRAETYLQLGNLLFEAGQLEDAIRCFERVHALPSLG